MIANTCKLCNKLASINLLTSERIELLSYEFKRYCEVVRFVNCWLGYKSKQVAELRTFSVFHYIVIVKVKATEGLLYKTSDEIVLKLCLIEKYFNFTVVTCMHLLLHFN